MDYKSIRDFNSRLGASPAYLALPPVPSVEMLLAAADRRNVYRPEDRLGDYIVAWNHEPDDDLPRVPISLVERYGMQRAFEICVIADIWYGCIDGFEEWRRRRGREGGTHFVESWLKALPVECPEGGWPEAKDTSSAIHDDHATSRPTETVADQKHWWREVEKLGAVHAPAMCVSIMALRSRQRESASLLFSTVEELVDHDRLPYVPRYSRDHHFDDDERSSMLIAAAWHAASAEFLANEVHTPMPADRFTHAALMIDALSRHSNYRSEWKGFYTNAPYSSVSVTTPLGRLEASVDDMGLSWEIEADNGRKLTRRCGIDLRIPSERERFYSALEEFDQSKDASVSWSSI